MLRDRFRGDDIQDNVCTQVLLDTLIVPFRYNLPCLILYYKRSFTVLQLYQEVIETILLFKFSFINSFSSAVKEVNIEMAFNSHRFMC